MVSLFVDITTTALRIEAGKLILVQNLTIQVPRAVSELFHSSGHLGSQTVPSARIKDCLLEIPDLTFQPVKALNSVTYCRIWTTKAQLPHIDWWTLCKPAGPPDGPFLTDAEYTLTTDGSSSVKNGQCEKALKNWPNGASSPKLVSSISWALGTCTGPQLGQG